MSDSQLTPSDQNLIWIDLEMTGLVPERDRVIEVAVVVTDANLDHRTEGPVFAIHHSDATRDARLRCCSQERRCVRFGAYSFTGTRTGTHARQPSQYGRYVKIPLRRNPILTSSL